MWSSTAWVSRRLRVLISCDGVAGAAATTADGLSRISTTPAAARFWIASEHETSGASARIGESGKHEHELWLTAGVSMNAA